MNKKLAAIAVAASMAGGAGASIALLGPSAASAASTSAASAATAAPTATAAAPAWMSDALKKLVDAGTITQAQADAVSSALAAAHPPDGPGRPGGPGGRHELGDDMTIAASAVGIAPADLKTALDSGNSLADVAKANSVDPQKVIDALVADEKAELADQVKNGTLTQAQADQLGTNITQRVTDRVNGVRPAAGPGHDGPPPAASGSTATTTTA